VAIDTTREFPLSLTDTAKVYPKVDKRGWSPSAVFRHIRQGLRGGDGSIVKLESVRVGARLCSSAEAVHRFFAALSEADMKAVQQRSTPINDKPSKSRTPEQRDRDVAAAEKRLAASGV
jgi:hypothetical protein